MKQRVKRRNELDAGHKGLVATVVPHGEPECLIDIPVPEANLAAR